MAEQFRCLPPASIESFVAAYGAFVSAIQAAMEQAASRDSLSEKDGTDVAGGTLESAGGTLENDSERISDGRRLLSLLESKYEAIRTAAADSAKDDAATITRCALEAVGLAKNLDFVRLDFAGAQDRNQIDGLVTRVVLAAYAVSLAAGLC